MSDGREKANGNTPETESGRMLCVKMRAARAGEHVSGAERIVEARLVPKTVAALTERALSHGKGTPDFVNVKVETPGGIIRLKALPVTATETATPQEGLECAAKLFSDAGIARAREIVRMLQQAHTMRGAMLVDADTLERLEPDGERGVRATCMDADGPCACGVSSGKNHFAEAVVLATKVANAPGIVGEICISDDPDYVTGYVASKSIGYHRITVVKEKGDGHGGRIFLYRGRRNDVSNCIRYLESQCILVEGVPPSPDTKGLAGENRLNGVTAELAEIRNAGLERVCRTLHSPAGPVARIAAGGGMREVAMLASNDYLDLARDPRVVAAAANAAKSWGAGSGGSRLTTGTQALHEMLEQHIASFKHAEAAILYATGYMANVGALTALAGKGDVIFSDELNHASIVDGCRLSGADIVIYRHCDMDDLKRKLQSARGRCRRLVVTDGVFSMDGDMPDLPRFIAICRECDAFSIVDEAHATGVAGATGRGLSEHFGCAAPDLSIGTLSKALGSEGGFACGNAEIIRLLKNKSRPFIFSTAPGAPAVAAADAAFSILEVEPSRVAALRENVAFFLRELSRHGVTAQTQSAIVPIVVGDELNAVKAADALLEKGFLVSAIRYPSVAKGSARLRIAIMSSHSQPMLADAAAAIAEALRRA